MIFDTNLTSTSGYDEDTFEKLKRAREGCPIESSLGVLGHK